MRHANNAKHARAFEPGALARDIQPPLTLALRRSGRRSRLQVFTSRLQHPKALPTLIRVTLHRVELAEYCKVTANFV